MATAGLRVGALAGIAVNDLEYIDKYSLYAITVYSNTNSEYLTFLTPQTSELMRRFIGNRADSKPVFYNLFEPDLPLTQSAHVVGIWRLLVKAGLRQPTTTTEHKAVMMDHGFRKHYRTQLDASGMREDYGERLMGHGVNSLVERYTRPKPTVWLETSGYLAAIPHLTY
jgi:integrase